MLEHCKSAKERWGGVSEIIDRWLNARQHLLVEYCYLSDSVESIDNASCGQKVVQLCQILVDYVGAGHFEVYDQLIQEGIEFNDQSGLKTASVLFKKVDQTTEEILEFNDKYQEVDDLDAIETDLSRLGETLAVRFEAEDSMIEVLHFAHQEVAEQSA
jgi:regulator of sigma D